MSPCVEQDELLTVIDPVVLRSGTDMQQSIAAHSPAMCTCIHQVVRLALLTRKGQGYSSVLSTLTTVPLKQEMERVLMGCSVGPIPEDSSPARVEKGKGSPAPYCPAATLQIHLVELFEEALLLSSLRVPA